MSRMSTNFVVFGLFREIWASFGHISRVFGSDFGHIPRIWVRFGHMSRVLRPDFDLFKPVEAIFEPI